MPLQEYIQRVKRLGPNTVINSRNFNQVIDEIQHNVDILYNNVASNHIEWGASEKIFGNLFDIDSAGQTKFVNGGKFDTLEKVNSFTPSDGTIIYTSSFSSPVSYVSSINNWLRWDVDAGETNISLTRNIPIPAAVRHQNFLIGFKIYVTGLYGLELDERWDIIVNDTNCGAADTQSSNRVKSIFGVYHSSGSETNLEVKLQRSLTNGSTSTNYVVRITEGYIGLHTSSQTAEQLNFPTYSYIDVEDFYDFQNNSVRPLPLFLFR